MDKIFIGKFSKGPNSVKTYVELQLFLSAYRLMVVYMCSKFQENIPDSIKVIERTRFFIEKIPKGHTCV